MIVANVLVVGAGLGAYGARMVRAELPHGPVELAAYALALGLYLQGRRRALPAAHLVDRRGDERRAACARCRARDLRERMRPPVRILLVMVLLAGAFAASDTFLKPASPGSDVAHRGDSQSAAGKGQRLGWLDRQHGWLARPRRFSRWSS